MGRRLGKVPCELSSRSCFRGVYTLGRVLAGNRVVVRARHSPDSWTGAEPQRCLHPSFLESRGPPASEEMKVKSADGTAVRTHAPTFRAPWTRARARMRAGPPPRTASVRSARLPRPLRRLRRGRLRETRAPRLPAWPSARCASSARKYLACARPSWPRLAAELLGPSPFSQRARAGIGGRCRRPPPQDLPCPARSALLPAAPSSTFPGASGPGDGAGDAGSPVRNKRRQG